MHISEITKSFYHVVSRNVVVLDAGTWESAALVVAWVLTRKSES